MKTVIFSLAALTALSIHSPLRAQDDESPPPPATVRQTTALQAVSFARTSGAELVRAVEITGEAGQPMPRTWLITTYDPRSKSKTRDYEVHNRRVRDDGTSREYYPDHLPEGVFRLDKVKLDSDEAFRIADAVAGKAQVGFDSINYRLRCREFTEEPVWSLSLLDEDESVVGVVNLSAVTGTVLRTVWMKLDPDTEELRVIDSALEGLRTISPGPSSDEPGPEMPDPDAEPLEPLPPEPQPPVPGRLQPLEPQPLEPQPR